MNDQLSDVRRSRRILQICDVAVTLTDDERRIFLEQICDDDHAMLAEVKSLLGAIDHSGRFLSIDIDQLPE